MVDPPRAASYPSDKFREHEVIGQILKATSRTATRSGASASILCAGLLLLAPANAALAQVTPASASDTVRADTTNNLVVSSDTTKEVKHVVKKGDTLWDLAKYYLKDPFRWPEIFRRNTDVVENPHWIYPGEVIRIWGHEVKTEALARADSAGEVVSHVTEKTGFIPTQNAATAASEGGRSDMTVFASPLSRTARAAATNADVIGRLRAGAVRPGEVEAAPYAERGGGPRNPGRLTASVDRPGIKTSIVRSRFQLNDDVYIELPKGSIGAAGETFMSYVLGPDMDQYGQVVIPTGILRIETASPGRRSLARIVKQFGEILLDQNIISAPELNVPTGPATPLANGARGRVVYVHEEPVLPSIGHYVLVSLSSKNGVQIGDQISFIDNTTGTGDDGAAPPVIAAYGQVVRATPYAASVIITHQVQPTIRDDMPVRLTGKTP
jgi:LysM repeat protein